MTDAYFIAIAVFSSVYWCLYWSTLETADKFFSVGLIVNSCGMNFAQHATVLNYKYEGFCSFMVIHTFQLVVVNTEAGSQHSAALLYKGSWTAADKHTVSFLQMQA
jgi:hypothetical protein